MNNIRVSNSLDPDQARRFVGPDLCQNCFQDYQQMIKFAQKSKLFDSVGLQASPSYCWCSQIVGCVMCMLICFALKYSKHIKTYCMTH